MSKDKKNPTNPKRDPEIKFDYQEFYQNSLSLPQAFKDRLKAEGLDFRFLNRNEYNKNGNTHRAHWRAYKLVGNPEDVGLLGVTAEGHIQRGDLILGVRDKQMSAGHKKFLQARAKQYQGHNKAKAQEIRQLAKEHGVDENTEVFEGYDENS